MDVRFVLRVIEDSLFVALDKDIEASIDQLFGSCGCQCSATLEFLLLASQPERRLRHPARLTAEVCWVFGMQMDAHGKIQLSNTQICSDSIA